MEHFFRIAFWITLSGCLQIKSLPISDFGKKLMETHVECPPDATFYAPTNVKRECITTALDCVMRELHGRAKEECEGIHQYINMAVGTLDHVIEKRSAKGHALNNSTECACERWIQIPFRDFLDKASSLLELANADA
ncbi:uncharacterized protein il2 [Sebastes fasciatus]|uniref:uncharacterized protein il2 n=1 Tax=Sebastes fasciatus TaxID=394691 RepID=UPI003D9F71B4